tara:strand:+ start:169 stop:564 length:396 start_codon:yes stop_codon:yes gene_type:complete
MSTYLGAAGIGVNNLEASEAFYCDVFGMKRLQFLKLDDMDEIILGFPGAKGAAVVLMHYTDGSNPNYDNLPIKLAFYVDDIASSLGAITTANCEIVREPKVYEAMGNVTIAFGKDPNGYLVEMIEKPKKSA